MRESRTFAERTKALKSDEAIKKYFLVYEGSDTEVMYFDAVHLLREDIGINPLIELIPIIRSFSEEGWSNPKKILDRVIQNLRESKEQLISYESLLNRIMDYLYETKVITTSKVLARNIWKVIESFISTPENNQYRYVLDKCREMGFQFYVTNPCFEFWLLLHFDEVFQLDKQKLLDNPKVTAKRRYAENELRRIYPGYSKTRYYAEPFVRDIDKAIENEKEFCEDIEELKDSVGSNIGKLICEMRKNNKW